MKLKKELGQNFLINQTDINNFISFCNFEPIDIVLEIGPGNGVLTKQIAPTVNIIIAIELDSEMIPILNNLKIGNLEIQNLNFLDLNLRDFIEKHNITKIIGAIPYYISSPIVHKVIEEAVKPLEGAYLITQKEFAQKLIGKSNKRSYFTNVIEKYGKIEEGKIIKKESFNPTPKVDSLFFKIEYTSYPINILEVKNWEKFLHHVFKTPRKKINKRFDKDILKTMGIDENLRPENLDVNQINDLFNKYPKSL